MASAFSESLVASGGWNHPPPKISGTTKGMVMKFLPQVSIHKEAQIKKFFDITGLVCKLQNKILKISIFGNATSRHANFMKFGRIINVDVRNEF